MLLKRPALCGLGIAGAHKSATDLSRPRPAGVSAAFMLRRALLRLAPAISGRPAGVRGLIAFGAARRSSSAAAPVVGHAQSDPASQTATGEASPDGRLLIGFTCSVCSTRTHRTMSRAAYTRGVVLVQCPGCDSRHLVADNLGWFGARPRAGAQQGEAPYEPLNVETMAADAGQEVRRSVASDDELHALRTAVSSASKPRPM